MNPSSSKLDGQGHILSPLANWDFVDSVRWLLQKISTGSIRFEICAFEICAFLTLNSDLSLLERYFGIQIDPGLTKTADLVRGNKAIFDHILYKVVVD